jgi:serine phosphatase RsbU (regulator of sigma subunit)/uncharacterized protein HemY
MQNLSSISIRFKRSQLIFVLLVCCFSINNSHAQNKKTNDQRNRITDSLLTLVKTDKEDTSKVIHLMQLCHANVNFGLYDTALRWGNEALQLAQRLDFKKGLASVYENIGAAYWYRSDYPKSLENWLNALKIHKELKNKENVAKMLGSIGGVYLGQADYSKALDYYLQALKSAEEIEDKNGIATDLSNIGSVYYFQKEFPQASNYYFKALKMAQELGDTRLQANTIGNIAEVYFDQKDYIKALDYDFKTLKLAEEFGYEDLKATVFGNLGSIYLNQKENSQALNYYLKAMTIAEKIKDKPTIANCLANLGSLYTSVSKFKEAESCFKKANAIYYSIGAYDGLRQAEESLSTLYDTLGDYDQAFAHYKKAIALRDTIFSQDQKKQLVQKQMNYEFDKKELAINAENEKQKAVAEEKGRRQKFIIYSIAWSLLVMLLFAGIVFRSLRTMRQQKKIIELKKIETDSQKKIIEEKNKDITASINYAKHIQNALLREEEHISKHLPQHFILFMPKDIVSGDFYWGAEKQGYWYFAAVDCTGHGVPGAIMSMLGISFLNDIMFSETILTPAEILDRLRDKIIRELRQKDESIGNKDGMDISLSRLNLKTNELQWAGANNALNLIRDGQLQEVKADKQPVGYYPEPRPFTNHEMQMQKGDSIYIYSDGYADQFGGPKGKKLTYKKLENIIIANNTLPMKEQKELLKKQFIEWKGLLDQVDDVCVFGVRI